MTENIFNSIHQNGSTDITQANPKYDANVIVQAGHPETKIQINHQKNQIPDLLTEKYSIL